MACTASSDAVCGNITLVDGLLWSLKSTSPMLAQIQQTIRIAGTLEIVGSHFISMSDGVIEIPQLGSKHSLNISVSAGIVLWEFSKKYLSP